MSNEILRIVRTLTQAVVAMGVTWLAARGVDLEVEAAMIVVFPLVMAAVTALVKILQDRVPLVGSIIGWLNGPPKEVLYVDPVAGQ